MLAKSVTERSAYEEGTPWKARHVAARDVRAPPKATLRGRRGRGAAGRSRFGGRTRRDGAPRPVGLLPVGARDRGRRVPRRRRHGRVRDREPVRDHQVRGQGAEGDTQRHHDLRLRRRDADLHDTGWDGTYDPWQRPVPRRTLTASEARSLGRRAGGPCPTPTLISHTVRMRGPKVFGTANGGEQSA